MQINEECLPCLINQIIKVAKMTKVSNKEALYHHVFEYLSTLDFTMTNPEVIGATFEMLKLHINNDDPYKNIRDYYNELFLKEIDIFEAKIDSFDKAVKYAIIGNIIDFNPIHNSSISDITRWFDNVDNLQLTIDHIDKMIKDIKKAKSILYLGDNCGEICLDKILIKKIKEINPAINIYFGVRGKPVVNDSIMEDAYFVGIDQEATIISNGDNSLGTILHRTSQEFRSIYKTADIIIAKGQANYESLSEEKKNIYFLLMVKCNVIAKYIGVDLKSLVCLNAAE